MAGFNFPWSGDVTQAINPWELWIRSISAQTGFINIRNVSTGDPGLEQEIVETVAGYGRQLGRIGEAVDVLTRRPRLLDGLDATDRQAIEDFQAMMADIAAVKARRTPPGKLLEALDEVLAGLNALKDRSPEIYETAMGRIRAELDPPRIEGPKSAKDGS